MLIEDRFNLEYLRIGQADIQRLERKLYGYLQEEMVEHETRAKKGVTWDTVRIDKSVKFQSNRLISMRIENQEVQHNSVFDIDDMEFSKCNSISLQFSSPSGNKSVSIKMREGSDWDFGVRIAVSGADRRFVHTAVQDLREALNAAAPIGAFYRRFRLVINAALIATWVGSVIVGERFIVKDLYMIGISVPSFIGSWIGVLASAIGALFIVSNFSALFPKLEFDFGPSHMRPVAKARKALVYMVGTFLFPFFVGALVNFLI